MAESGEVGKANQLIVQMKTIFAFTYCFCKLPWAMNQGSKPAFQKRSQKTRDRIVAALDRLLLKREFSEIGVNDLADEAKISPGAIYRRFEGGVLAVLFELWQVELQRVARAPEAQLELSRYADLRSALHHVAEMGWSQLHRRAHVYRAVYIHARLRPELVPSRSDALEREALGGFRALLSAYDAEVRRSDKERAAAVIAYFFNTVMLERALFPERLPEWAKFPDSRAFASEVAELAYGYLTSSG